MHNNFHVETIKLLWYRCFPETCSRLAIDKDIFYIPNNFSFQEIPKYWLWAFPSNNLISLLFRCRHSIQCKFIRIFFKHWNCCDKKLTPRSYVLNNKYVMDVFWNVLIICKKRYGPKRSRFEINFKMFAKKRNFQYHLSGIVVDLLGVHFLPMGK